MSITAGKIKWDAAADRKYELGVDHCVIYTKDSSKWVGEAWNGITEIAENPSGADAQELYADNMLYAVLRSMEKYGCTINAYTFPDSFAACNGYLLDSTNGFSVGQQGRAKFCLCYRTDMGDAEDSALDTENKYKLHLVWGLTCSPSERTHSTINDSPDAETMSWECSAENQVPQSTLTVDGKTVKPTAHMEVLSTATHIAVLEEILYGKDPTTQGGSDGEIPEMPTLDEVIHVLVNGTRS